MSTAKQMTDAEKEWAARALCSLRGINPDMELPFSDLAGTFSATYTRAWVLTLQEITDQERLEYAMAVGRSYRDVAEARAQAEVR